MSNRATPIAAATPIVGTTAIPGAWVALGDDTQVGIDLLTDDTAAGTWTVEVSCKPVAPALAAGSGCDVTSALNPAVVAVTAGAGASHKQFVQLSPINAAWARPVFTPTAGANAESNLRSGK